MMPQRALCLRSSLWALNNNPSGLEDRPLCSGLEDKGKIVAYLLKRSAPQTKRSLSKHSFLRCTSSWILNNSHIRNGAVYEGDNFSGWGKQENDFVN